MSWFGLDQMQQPRLTSRVPKFVLKRSSPPPKKSFWARTNMSPDVKVRQAFSELQSAKTHVEKTKSNPERKNLKSVIESYQARYALMWLHTKLFFRRDSLGRKLSQSFVRSIIGILLSSFVYICFIDTFFLIKQYDITFSNQSYLEESRLNTLLHTINSDSLGGIIPLNSYWFLNTESLTSIGHKVSPDITSVQLVGREWPSTAKLLITTEPIAATLNYGSNYTIISRNGKILGKDTVSLRSNVIRLNSFSTPNDFLTEDILNANNKNLLQKVFFTLTVQNLLADLELPVTESVISSDVVIDSDIVITVNKTRLLFAYDALSSENLTTRVTKMFKDTSTRQQIMEEKINYIDMRFAKTIFVCMTGTSCAN